MRMEPAEQKLTLRALCLKHRIALLTLARASNMHPLLVWDMLVGNAVSREMAHMLLCGFNELAGTTYMVDDIQVVLEKKRD